ncbi:MAG TPA: DUF3240 family protein [Rhodocyclaceae bacterium]
MNRNACLKLVLPRSLEEQVVDHLLRHPEWAAGFTAYTVDGHGTPHQIASSVEQVRGRAGRVQLEILTRDADTARELVEHLKADMPNADVLWWVAPVLASGDFR